MPGFFWYHAHLAMIYAELGKIEEARAATVKLLELYPNFVEDYYNLTGSYNTPDEITVRQVDGLRKAGLDIPDRPPETH